jgi:hypothetical protein
MVGIHSIAGTHAMSQHPFAMNKPHLSFSLAAIFVGLSATHASILLSVENFAIFGGTAITSSGTEGTVISNGDVGLSPGATSGITGFPPAVITNGVIVDTGPVTSQARLDLIQLQTGLASMPSNTNLTTHDLGGLTLGSGVYTLTMWRP